MGKYIIKVKIMLNSNIVSGFVNRNKHGKYYPSAAHSMIFDNLITALLSLEQLKESYGVLGYDILNIDKDITIDVNNLVIGDVESLKSVIYDIIKFKLGSSIDISESNFKLGIDNEGTVVIEWFRNVLYINNYGCNLIPGSIEWSLSSSGKLVTFDDELLTDLATIIQLYRTGNSLNVILDKYNININQL